MKTTRNILAPLVTLAAGAAMMIAASAHAATWTNALTNGDINNAANWSGGLPSDATGNGAIVAGTPLVINQVFANGTDNRSEYLVTGPGGLTVQAGGNFTYLGDGLIGSTALSAGGASVVTQTGGTITQDGGGAGLLIGHNAMGTWNLQGGVLNYTGAVGHTVVGFAAGANGSQFNISGGVANMQRDLNVGQGATGSLAVSGTGDLNVGLSLNVGNGAAGQLNQSGGTIDVTANTIIGGTSVGTAVQTGGAFATNGSMVLANAAGGAGSSYTFSGGTYSVTGDLRVGTNGAATFGLDGSGGTVANLGRNLTFDRDDSTLAVTIDSPTAFTALNAGTINGNIMMIKTDAAGITGADLNVTLDIDLAPGSYAWTIINIVPVGVYGVSGVYFENNVTVGAGAIGYFNGLADNATFTVFSTPTNTAYTFRIDYDGGNGNDLVLSTTVLAVVPAPAALPAGLALLGLAAARRRRSHR